ncbi:MAG: FHA domain-containing protein [Gammaproteobacteria bacterium]|nr:FHA domain-containing protein [Gammaproteobacteria bacterium]
MSDDKEDPRAVPADQRSKGPNHTMMLSSDELSAQVASAATGDRSLIQGVPRLVGRSEPVEGVQLDLTKSKTTIGRADNSDLVIKDGTVSSRHAQIVNENGVWRVVNLISTNGTSVNGNTAIVGYLSPGDVIAFGRVEMLFEADGEAHPTRDEEVCAEEAAGQAVASGRAGRGSGPGTVLLAGLAVLLSLG